MPRIVAICMTAVSRYFLVSCLRKSHKWDLQQISRTVAHSRREDPDWDCLLAAFTRLQQSGDLGIYFMKNRGFLLN
jgi:hypothetical protein